MYILKMNVKVRRFVLSRARDEACPLARLAPGLDKIRGTNLAADVREVLASLDVVLHELEMASA